jgi:hypothetical protein
MTDNSLEDAFHRICISEAPLSERLSSFSEVVRQFGRPFAEVMTLSSASGRAKRARRRQCPAMSCRRFCCQMATTN